MGQTETDRQRHRDTKTQREDATEVAWVSEGKNPSTEHRTEVKICSMYQKVKKVQPGADTVRN